MGVEGDHCLILINIWGLDTKDLGKPKKNPSLMTVGHLPEILPQNFGLQMSKLYPS
jgi:hypothetical protein